MSTFVEWSSLGNILLYGLIVGAGLPALFALGVRTIAGPGARDADGNVSLTRRIVAWSCFGVTILAVAGAVAFIAAGGH